MIIIICSIFGVGAILIIFFVVFDNDLTKMCLEPEIRLLAQLEHQSMVISSYCWKSDIVRAHKIQIQSIIEIIEEDRWKNFTNNKYIPVLIKEVEEFLDESYGDWGLDQQGLQKLKEYDEKLVKYAAKLSYQLYRVGYRVGTPSYEVRPDNDENTMYFDFWLGDDYQYLDPVDYVDPENFTAIYENSKDYEDYEDPENFTAIYENSKDYGIGYRDEHLIPIF